MSKHAIEFVENVVTVAERTSPDDHASCWRALRIIYDDAKRIAALMATDDEGPAQDERLTHWSDAENAKRRPRNEHNI